MASNIIGPEEQLSTGTLSTLLTKLEFAGLIHPVDPASVLFPTEHSSRAFAITSAGRERFLELMMDTTSHPGAYSRLFHIKSLHLEFLPPEQQLFLVEHYLLHCQQVMGAKHIDKEDMTSNPLKQEHMSSTLRMAASALIQLKNEQWKLELTWGQSLREQIVLRLKQHEENSSISS